MIRRERRDGGEGEERGLRKGEGTSTLASACFNASLLSCRLDSAVKRCSSEVLKLSFQQSCSVKVLPEETSEY